MFVTLSEPFVLRDMPFDFAEEPLGVVQNLVHKKNPHIAVLAQPEERVDDRAGGGLQVSNRCEQKNELFAKQNIEPRQVQLAQLVVAQHVPGEEKEVLQAFGVRFLRHGGSVRTK